MNSSSKQSASGQASGHGNYIRSVALVGGTGRQGQYIVHELLKTGRHKIRILTRSGTNDFPDSAEVAVVDYAAQDSLVRALHRQDVLVITMSPLAPKDTSFKLIEAAASAGVPWIVPDEWGIDTTNIQFGSEALLGPPKVAARELIERLGVSSWIGIACGCWYQYSLGTTKHSFGFDFQNKDVTFFDDGNHKTTTSTHEQVGRAVASLLSMKIFPEDKDDVLPNLDRYRNKLVYIKSFTLSQRDMLNSVQRVTHTTDVDWHIGHQSSKERIMEGTKELQDGARVGFMKVLYTRTMCFEEGNFELKDELANETLGLPVEDLDQCTKEAIALGKLS